MAATGLEVRFREGRERAEVTRFTSTLHEIVLALREIDRVYVARATRATWVLADLEHDRSDLVVRLEARPSPRRRSMEDMLVPVEAFVGGINALALVPEVPELYLPQTVERVADLARGRDGVEEVSVATYNGQVGPRAALSGEVLQHATEAVRPRETSLGSFAGVLDLVAHKHRGSGKRLSIYDRRSRHAVTGTAPDTLQDELRENWGHRVLAGGRVTRNNAGQLIRIDVDRIETLPPGDTGRPDVRQLLGAAPDWLDGRTVDEFIEAVRSA